MIFLFVFLVGFAIYTIIKKGDYKVVYLSTEFDGKVIDIYEEKGNTYLLLTNRNNRYRIEDSRNYDYNPSFLYNFLHKEAQIKLKNKMAAP